MQITTPLTGQETKAEVQARLIAIAKFWAGDNSLGSISTWGGLRELLNTIGDAANDVTYGEQPESLLRKINWMNDTDAVMSGDVPTWGAVAAGAAVAANGALELARAYAENDEDVPVEPGTNSSKHYSIKAAASETLAGQHAAAALASKNSAALSSAEAGAASGRLIAASFSAMMAKYVTASPGAGQVIPAPGDIITELTFGLRYRVVASGGQITTPGGVQLVPLRPDEGSYNAQAWGAVCDGVADDTAEINAAATFMRLAGKGGELYIPGTPLITGAVDFSGDYSVRMDGGNVEAGFRVTDPALLEPVTFGAVQMFTGRIMGLNFSRPSYNGTTENCGVVFKNVAGATIIDLESRFSKYPIRFAPGSGQRVGYVTFVNLRTAGGLRNISVALSGTGWANEIVFMGGKCFTTSDTESNVHIVGGVNHWRFIGMSLEGTGQQAAYVDGVGAAKAHSIVFDQCRTEGTWAVNDIVLGVNTLRCEVRGWNLYTTVTDNGVDNLPTTASQGMTLNLGANLVTPFTINRGGLGTNVPIVDLNDTFVSSGESYGLRYSASRAAGVLINLLYSTTELFKVAMVNTTEALLTAVGRAIFRRSGSARTDPVVSVQDEFASSGTANAMAIRVGRNSGKVLEVVNHGSGAVLGGLYLNGTSVQLKTASSGWQNPPIVIGTVNMWVDTLDRLRMKNGIPTGDFDGVLVGAQTP